MIKVIKMSDGKEQQKNLSTSPSHSAKVASFLGLPPLFVKIIMTDP